MQTLFEKTTRSIGRSQQSGMTRTDTVYIAANDTRFDPGTLYKSGKRAIDVMGAIALLLCAAPVMLCVATAIKLESGGPVFFSQLRCGLDGRRFRFWKFRSMVVDAEAQKNVLIGSEKLSGGVRFKMKNDPRITRVGRFIRRYSIDELPQLWNVVIGDMSLVGPRPPLPTEVARYSDYEHRRLGVIPGITCTWQIGGRSSIPFHQQVEMDLAYIAARSLLSDLLILFRTPLAVISARGAC